MNCHRIQSLISAYVDSEMPGVEMLAVRQHLRECTECRLEFESILKIKRSMGRLRQVQPSDSLAAAICLRLNTPPAPVETVPVKTSFLTALQKHIPALPNNLGFASACAGLLVMLLLISRSSSNTNGYTYDPQSPTLLARSFIQQDPAQVYSVTADTPTVSFKSTAEREPSTGGWSLIGGSSRNTSTHTGGGFLLADYRY